VGILDVRSLGSSLSVVSLWPGHFPPLCARWHACPKRPSDSGIDRRGCYSVLQRATVRLMKIRTITQRELRNQSAAVLREVEAGRTIIVSRNGTPVGELRPIKRRRFVPRAAIADAAGRAARIDAAQFRADLDAVVDPHPND
jgi:prevent-host-death family protein